ncbi:MAG: hypothetical protein IPM36_24750 [Lewinellaceae bacterium]|nr:hypothetical protein [Lewinellaceae bacterium]
MHYPFGSLSTCSLSHFNNSEATANNSNIGFLLACFAASYCLFARQFSKRLF